MKIVEQHIWTYFMTQATKKLFQTFQRNENKKLTSFSLHQSSVSLMFFYSDAILGRDFENLFCVENLAQESTSYIRSKIPDDASNHTLC